MLTNPPDAANGASWTSTPRKASLEPDGKAVLAHIADAYPDLAANGSKNIIEGDPKATAEVVGKLLDRGLEEAVSVLDHDIENAPRILQNKRDLQRYLHEAADTRSLISGLAKGLTGAEYVRMATEIGRASTPEGSERATGELLMRLSKDLSTLGVSRTTTAVFGAKRAAALTTALTTGPVGFLLTLTSEIGQSTETAPRALDEHFLLYVKDPRASLESKQQAMAAAWRSFDRNGRQWQPSQKRELLEATALLYHQAETAQGARR